MLVSCGSSGMWMYLFVELELIPRFVRSYYKAVELGYLTKDPAAYQHDRDQCGCDQHGYWLWPIQSRPIQPRQTNRSRIFSLHPSFSLCSHFHLYYLLFSQFCRWALGNCAVGMYYLECASRESGTPGGSEDVIVDHAQRRPCLSQGLKVDGH